MNERNNQNQIKISALVSVLASGNRKVTAVNFYNELWAMQYIRFQWGKMYQFPPMSIPLPQ